jgi:predicted nucleic acid-binding Zn ribbon protein
MGVLNVQRCKNMKVPTFSPVCIFCSCKDSVVLNQDGSFRQCKKCNKQFKSTFSTFSTFQKGGAK